MLYQIAFMPLQDGGNFGTDQTKRSKLASKLLYDLILWNLRLWLLELKLAGSFFRTDIIRKNDSVTTSSLILRVWAYFEVLIATIHSLTALIHWCVFLLLNIPRTDFRKIIEHCNRTILINTTPTFPKGIGRGHEASRTLLQF